MNKLYVSTVSVAATLLLAGALLSPAAEEHAPQPKQTSNEAAANGPLPGDASLFENELRIAKKYTSPGYYPSLNAAEIADAQRSGFFPAASFTGSFDGPNQVFAWRSADRYQGLTYMVNRQPGELYLVGGDYPPPAGPMPPGPFVAKADATTGKEIWRTYLDNANASGRWIGNANLNILDNGNIPFAWSNRIVLIDGDTGRVLKHNMLPAGEAPAADVNYKHLTIAPDRTLILKCQTRPIGETSQGTVAIIRGVMAGKKQPNSHLVAVHPDTLAILHDVPLPEPATSPHIIAQHGDRIAIYIPGVSSIFRYFWDPATKQLSQDATWIMKPMKPGQSTSTAPTMVGEWVAVQTNGAPTNKVASSIVIAHQDDAANMHTIFPFGDLKPGEWSFCPPKPGADPENNMIYSADDGVGKVAGIKINPETGELSNAFVVENRTTTFQPVIGSKEHRVLLLTNMKLNNPKQPIMEATLSGNYREQLTWRDAATGRILAESDFFEPITINSLTTPGFGGRVYFPTINDFIVMQVMPKPEAALGK